MDINAHFRSDSKIEGMHKIFSLLLVMFFSCSSFAQNQPDSLKEKFNKTVQEKKREFKRLFTSEGPKIKKYTPQFILDKIDHDSNYHFLFIAEYWIADHYKEMIPHLILRLTDKTKVGLINTADLIIWERIQSGQLKFYGHGGVSSDDLFTIAGRANRLLSEISGQDFGHVSMYSKQDDLIQLQNKWQQWITLLNK